MYFRVYSHCLDYNKNWYAYNDLLFGYPKSNRKHGQSAVFQLYPDEVKKVNIADLQDRNGKQPSYRWFNVRVQKAKDVYAITSFGRFLLAVRQPSPSQEWLESSGCQNINNIINTVCLEQFSGDDSGNDYTSQVQAHSNGKTTTTSTRKK
jgi:hypothetical protein